MNTELTDEQLLAAYLNGQEQGGNMAAGLRTVANAAIAADRELVGEAIGQVIDVRAEDGAVVVDGLAPWGAKLYLRPAPAAQQPDGRDCGCAHYWNCPSLKPNGKKPVLRSAPAAQQTADVGDVGKMREALERIASEEVKNLGSARIELLTGEEEWAGFGPEAIDAAIDLAAQEKQS